MSKISTKAIGTAEFVDEAVNHDAAEELEDDACPICGKVHNGSALDKVVGAAHRMVFMFLFFLRMIVKALGIS